MAILLEKTLKKIRAVLLAGLIWAAGFYKGHVSIILMPSCRFSPTCSTYFLQALKKYGIIRGLIKGVLRILRCNPFFTGGYDPIINDKKGL